MCKEALTFWKILKYQEFQEVEQQIQGRTNISVKAISEQNIRRALIFSEFCNQKENLNKLVQNMQQAGKQETEHNTFEDQESHNSDTQLFQILTEESEDQSPPQPEESQNANQGQNLQSSETQIEEIKEDPRSRLRSHQQNQQRRGIRQSDSSPEIPISLDNLPEHIRSKFQKFTIFRDQGEELDQQTALPNRLVEEEKHSPEETKNPIYATPVGNRPPRHPDSRQGGSRSMMTSAYHTVSSARGGLFQDSRPFFFHRLSNSSTLEDRGRQVRVPLQKLREPDSIIKRLDFDQSQSHITSSPGKSPKWGHLNSRSLPR